MMNTTFGWRSEATAVCEATGAPRRVVPGQLRRMIRDPPSWKVPLMNKPQILVLIGVLCGSAGAQSNRDDLTPLEIGYALTVRGDLTKARVDIDVEHISRPVTRVAMPNWRL